MFGILASIAKWLFSKAAMLLLIWILVLGAVALYLGSQRYLKALPEELKEKEANIQRIRAEAMHFDEKIKAVKTLLHESLDSINAKGRELQGALEKCQARLQVWQSKLDSLTGVKGRALGIWNNLRGIDSRSQIDGIKRGIASGQEREFTLLAGVKDIRARGRALEEGAKARQATLEQAKATTLGDLERAEAEHALAKSQTERWQGRVNQGQQALRAAYKKMGKPLIIISLSIIFIPILAKIALFYFWAPLLSWGRPVVIHTEARAPVRVWQTAVAEEIVLEPGESATIQHRFYQASDEDLVKRTKLVFSWRYPFSCLACGLFLLTRVGNRHPQAKRRLTLSSQTEAEIEMAVVEIPQGGSIICRPSFVAALVQRSGEQVRIRSHWRFFSLHAWITLQFRYFEFRGPVKLVLWAYRGVRAERLTRENIIHGNERRTNQLATIGFTPSLSYRSRRSETFISYLRDQNPLFDDLFSGQGVFLCQQISRAEHHRKAGSFWAKTWNSLSKIIGI